MFEVFSNLQSFMYYMFVPKDALVRQKEVSACLQEKMCLLCPEMWTAKTG
jgi:hypothetical protein